MKFTKRVSDCGLRVVVVPMKDNPTVTVLVMVEAGSKYETKNITGLSHFLEHMCFKGTEKRPSAKHISGELDAIGSHYNAFTSQEYTGYYAKAEARHLDKLLDVVSDLYLHQTLPEAEIEKEKGVIIEEINMYEDMPHRHVHDLYMEVLYGDQPAGWEIAGTRESVKAMKRQDFVEYRNSHYVGDATTVIVTGNVDENKIFTAVERSFAGINRTEKKEKEKVVESQTVPQIKTKFKQTDQAHLVLGVRSFDVYDPRQVTLKVMEGVLSGGMSSRLFQKLREEMGVCYYVRAFEDSYTDHGSMAVAAGVTTERVAEVVSVLLGEFKKLATEKVGAEELQKVKDYMVGSMFLGLESSDSIAEFYGYQEVLRRPVFTPDDFSKKIRAVTADDIQTIAKEIFINKGLNFAIIGPFEDGKKFESILTF
jgi:predicted Zn-dependent peptidase